jgi:hypothetical protein
MSCLARPRCNNQIIPQRRLDTLGYEENMSMIEEIPLQEKERRLNEALDRLQRTVDTGGGVPDETFGRVPSSRRRLSKRSAPQGVIGGLGPQPARAPEI